MFKNAVNEYQFRHLLLENAIARKVLKMTMALPLLPEHLIVDGLEAIKAYAAENGLEDAFRQFFLMYMTNYWINQVGVSIMSVYDLDARTNNLVESFYNWFHEKVNCITPELWFFTGKLTQWVICMWCCVLSPRMFRFIYPGRNFLYSFITFKYKFIKCTFN